MLDKILEFFRKRSELSYERRKELIKCSTCGELIELLRLKTFECERLSSKIIELKELKPEVEKINPNDEVKDPIIFTSNRVRRANAMHDSFNKVRAAREEFEASQVVDNDTITINE